MPYAWLLTPLIKKEKQKIKQINSLNNIQQFPLTIAKAFFRRIQNKAK